LAFEEFRMLRPAAFISSPALLVGVAIVPVRAEDATPAATPRQGDPIEVNVSLDEFSVTPTSTALVARQPYHFVVTNTGTATHELVIEPAGAVDKPLRSGTGASEVENIAPGDTKALDSTFADAGSYQLACHVSGHYEAGMRALFEVR
jgi:uncharacterized cupredoxin-like copper-binding protein